MAAMWTACAIGLASTASPALAQSSPTGSEIFAKAVLTWSALPTPTYLSYAVVVTVERHGRAHVDRQRVVFRTVDRVGISRDASGAVTFGRPRYVPDVAFRLVPRDARDFDDAQGDAPEPAPSASSLPMIGHASVSAKRYAIELAGTERLHDRDVYHLRLTPLFDPRRNSVREMWVDTQTFTTWQLIDEARYTAGPARGTFLLTATYAPVSNAWLLRTVETSGALRFGFFAYGGNASVTFDDLRLPEKPPAAFCFDRAGYTQHREQCETSFDH